MNAVSSAGVLLKIGADLGKWAFTSPDMTLETTTGNYNIYLKPNGTGKVKFGTWAAKGAEAFDGVIPILDGAGNARNLMTCS